MRDEAIFLLENGIASVEDIDTACRTALGYPMGPFELMDLTGIDIGYLTKRTGTPSRVTRKTNPARVSRHWSSAANSAGRRAAVGTTTTRPAPGHRDRQNR